MTAQSMLNAIVFAVVGMALFAAGFGVMTRLLPGNLWKRVLEDREWGAAIILGAVALALGWIVAAAVH